MLIRKRMKGLDMHTDGHPGFIQNAVLDIKSTSQTLTFTPLKDSDRLPVMLQRYGCFYADRNYFTERQGLDSCLAILTFGGCGMIRTSAGESSLEQGSFVVINCMDYQYYRTVSSEGWDFKWFHFDGPLAAVYAKSINANRLYVFAASETADIRVHIGELFRYASKKTAYTDLLVSGKIITILNRAAEISLDRTAGPDVKYNNSCISKALEMIHDTFPEQITLSQLAEHAHISKYHFLRLFKSATGSTPHEYMISYRINESKKMLWQSRRSVADIAAASGFSDTNSYIRAFKRLCGVTPNAYRKEKAFPL